MTTDTLPVAAALLSGLVASGHCVAMCGPIASLAGRNGRGRRALLYQGGRLVSYTAMGASVGYLGVALGDIAGVAQWSLVLRLVLAAVLLSIGWNMLLRRGRRSLFERIGGRLWSRLLPLVGTLQPARSRRDLIVMGLLWGWLPCGMVYSMLAIAAVAGGPLGGASVMMAFGLGTLPAMIGISWSSARLATLRTRRSRRALGYALVLGGIWLAAMPVYEVFSTSPQTMHLHHAPSAGAASTTVDTAFVE